ncbi:pisatin demethylase [Lophiostoma macrostomum CBS 122681]|uniref:Pisatin demethylase n=1 Tax=Lophiostoma macrostomum CBS 122681 TaxID=1314788 RepID=A0A6A6SHT0_9PLEO|nr:pisatin demethylase [Lophiostoma macrostomum CBS 122681]
MIIETAISSARNFAVWGVVAFLSIYLFINRYGGGFSRIPGPWLASFTDLWRLFVVWGRRPDATHIALHEKHGPLVRTGPRTVLVNDLDAVKKIYALNAGFVKSGFYSVQMTVAKGRRLHGMFNTTDEKFHAKLRRAVSNAYAMSTLVKFEPLVDSTTTEFLAQLERRYANRRGEDGDCDFGTWLQFYAFDVIGELTYSTRLGFVERGGDVDHIIRDLEWLSSYIAVVGQMPFLDLLFLKNPIRMLLSKYEIGKSTSSVAIFARKHVAERLLRRAQEKYNDDKPASSLEGSRDFLSRFFEAHDKDPEFITEESVLALTVGNMFAGSDTTAISLRAIFYHLLKNPTTMRALLQEILDKDAAGYFSRSDGLVTWDEARNMPYLSAVIKEGLRIHPAVGLALERIVPPNGIEIAGQYIPGGTNVGCSAWVIHRDESIFGRATDCFRPERWLEASDARRTEMNNALFSFGAGARSCIGKNISLLEMHKLVPAVLRKFRIELVDPSAEWQLHNAWFVKQSGLRVRLSVIRNSES